MENSGSVMSYSTTMEDGSCFFHSCLPSFARMLSFDLPIRKGWGGGGGGGGVQATS